LTTAVLTPAEFREAAREAVACDLKYTSARLGEFFRFVRPKPDRFSIFLGFERVRRAEQQVHNVTHGRDHVVRDPGHKLQQFFLQRRDVEAARYLFEP
jgi:hypothetical protein